MISALSVSPLAPQPAGAPTPGTQPGASDPLASLFALMISSSAGAGGAPVGADAATPEAPVASEGGDDTAAEEGSPLDLALMQMVGVLPPATSVVTPVATPARSISFAPPEVANVKVPAPVAVAPAASEATISAPLPAMIPQAGIKAAAPNLAKPAQLPEGALPSADPEAGPARATLPIPSSAPAFVPVAAREPSIPLPPAPTNAPVTAPAITSTTVGDPVQAREQVVSVDQPRPGAPKIPAMTPTAAAMPAAAGLPADPVQVEAPLAVPALASKDVTTPIITPAQLLRADPVSLATPSLQTAAATIALPAQVCDSVAPATQPEALPAVDAAPAAPVPAPLPAPQLFAADLARSVNAPTPGVDASTFVPQQPTLEIAHHLDLARESEWLDSLARDIARSGDVDGGLRFRLNPANLGSLHVEMRQSDAGTAVRLTTETEAARSIIADAQPRLVAEARAQGVRIVETQVEVGAGSGSSNAATGEGQRHAEGRPQTLARTLHQREASDGKPTASARSDDRFA